jgi:hypothetical protein
VRVQIPTTDTAIASGGGNCVGEWPTCNDHYSGDWLTLTSSWTNYKLSFTSLSTPYSNIGMKNTDLQIVLGLFFQTPADITFDLWLDDVSFY